MCKEISNEDLENPDSPCPEADWGEIGKFVLTFNGYEYWGSFETCAEVANNRMHSTLTELRTCLFFEQRRWRHSDEDPKGEDLKYMHELVEGIRSHVLESQAD